MASDGATRFLTLDQAAEELNISRAQVYALVRRQDLAALKIGGRGQWRVERTKIEEYITKVYDDTSNWLDAHPFNPDAPETE